MASGATETSLKLASVHAFNLEVSGASKVMVKGAVNSLDCELSGSSQATFGSSAMSRLDVLLSGASLLKIEGSVDKMKAELSGSSVIEGGMTGKQADVSLSGASSAKFGSFEKVAKDLSGSSSLSFGN